MDSELALIEERLAKLPACLESLKLLALRYLQRGRCVKDGAIRLGRYRKYEHDHYHITIFPPAEPDWLVRKRSYEMPLDYLQLLSYANGLNIFGLSFFGFAPSMQEDLPRLDRSRGQCLDLTLANETWNINYKNTPNGSVYVGYRPYSEENAGYFMDEAGSLCAMLKGGSRIKQWPSLWQLLSDEIQKEERNVHDWNLTRQPKHT